MAIGIRGKLINSVQKLRDRTSLDERAGAFVQNRLKPIGQNFAQAGRNLSNFRPVLSQNLSRQNRFSMGDNLSYQLNKPQPFGKTGESIINTLDRFKQTTNPALQLPQQLAGGLISGQNLSMGGAPSRAPQSIPEKVAFGAGSMIGSVNPKSITGRTVGGFVKATNPLLKYAVKPFAGAVSSRLAAGGGNVIQGMAMDKALNRPTTPTGVGVDLASGLLLGPNQFDDALKPIGKGFGTGRNRNNQWNKQDIDLLDEVMDYVQQNKKIDLPTLNQIDKRLSELADGYLPKQVVVNIAQKYSNNPRKAAIEIGKELQKSFKRVGQESEFNLPKLGIVGDQKIDLSNKPQQLNVKKLNLPDEQRAVVRGLEEKTPRVQLANDVVKDMAETATPRKTALSMDMTAKRASEDLALRQRIVSNTKKLATITDTTQREKLLLQIAKDSKVSRQAGTDIARQLQARNILADPAATPMERVFKLLDNAGVDEKKYVKDAAKVDWNNGNQVVDFYRKHVPPKWHEWLDEFRYTNMLSSPNTQINNAFSNALQTAVVTPIEKTIAGGIDLVKSKLTGSEQKYFVRQGADYSKGYIKAMPEAVRNFRKALSGEIGITNLDMDRLPTASKGLMKAYSTPLRLLEASDQFFRTLVKGGEIESLKRNNLSPEEALKKAEESADYRLFRQKFDPNGELGQGVVLKVFDQWNSKIERLRDAPGGKWIVPFLKTPTNILKQGVEYSPLGFTTAIGAKNPIEQLAKASVGSAVFATAYGMAEAGLTTWDTPTNAKERAEFYDAGLQPYSVKIGDKWVSYSKLGVLAYPIAMASAMKWAKDNGLSDDKMVTAGTAAGGFLGFFADQSYVRGIGDIIDGLRGDEFKRDRAISNIPSQMVPYRSLQGWFARLVDPVYRKSTGKNLGETVVNSIKSQTPFLSKSLPAYETPTGQPSQRQFPGINSVSPLQITKEKPYEKQIFDNNSQVRLKDRQIKALEKKAESETDLPAQKANLVYVKDNDGKYTTIDMAYSPKMPKLSGSKEIDKKLLSAYKGELTTKENDIVKLYQSGYYTVEQAEKQLKQIDTIRDFLKSASGGGKSLITDSELMTAYRRALKASLGLSQPPKSQQSVATSYGRELQNRARNFKSVI